MIFAAVDNVLKADFFHHLALVLASLHHLVLAAIDKSIMRLPQPPCGYRKKVISCEQ